MVNQIELTTFVDSDHAHNKILWRSTTGLIIIAGWTPVIYSSKWQGAIETSTYGAEFCAMKTAVEETMVVHYMLQSVGV